jgi:hypothetical protein
MLQAAAGKSAGQRAHPLLMWQARRLLLQKR